jgi:hypothetical protein
VKTIQHKFVEYIPEILEEGILYITIKYSTAVHKCFCGCGNRVVTPFSPTDWKLIYDGKTVSLNPSIGNWNFDCKSHYWVSQNSVKFVRKWNDWEIDEGRKEDARDKAKFYKKLKKRK